jgi:cell filamentation protein
VTFDPFGDFKLQGYLRNLAKEKDPDIVRRLEHASFMTGIDAALDRLTKIKRLSYADVLETHRILFDAVYPWAGQDRQTTAPDLAISKGPVLVAHPQHIRRAVDYALAHGQDRKFMREKPGVIMGYLAYGHPFLDGNGRTIIVVHGVMAQRAAISIDWAATDKAGYLGALTKNWTIPTKAISTPTSNPLSAKLSDKTAWQSRSHSRLASMATTSRTRFSARRATRL